ncbi:MAG: hypothetical protein AAFW81_04270 [Pseudomonadota bacterium]
MKTVSALVALLTISACSTLDLSEASCGVSEGRCLEQCRAAPGAGQMACEDTCRAEANMCRAPAR